MDHGICQAPDRAHMTAQMWLTRTWSNSAGLTSVVGFCLPILISISGIRNWCFYLID